MCVGGGGGGAYASMRLCEVVSGLITLNQEFVYRITCTVHLNSHNVFFLGKILGEKRWFRLMKTWTKGKVVCFHPEGKKKKKSCWQPNREKKKKEKIDSPLPLNIIISPFFPLVTTDRSG